MFRDEPIQKARPENVVLAEALFELLDARAKLTKSIDGVPNYTGQYDSKDYYAEEQQDYNTAVDAYADAVRALVASEPTDMAIYYEHQKALDTPIAEIYSNHERIAWAFHDTGLWYLGDVLRYVYAGGRPILHSTAWDRILPLFPGPKDNQKTFQRTLYNSVQRTYHVPFDPEEAELHKWVRPEEKA